MSMLIDFWGRNSNGIVGERTLFVEPSPFTIRIPLGSKYSPQDFLIMVILI